MGTEEKLAKMTAEQREAEKKRMEEMKKKHNDHPKVNHPVCGTVIVDHLVGGLA